MSESVERRPGWPDPEFWENRSKYPAEELWKLAGKHVAWTPDGTRLLASGDTREQLAERLKASGIDLSQVVWDYADDPDVSYLG